MSHRGHPQVRARTRKSTAQPPGKSCGPGSCSIVTPNKSRSARALAQRAGGQPAVYLPRRPVAW